MIDIWARNFVEGVIGVKDKEGHKKWRKNGILHRTDGPALECSDGSKYWFYNDKLHREDGPAIELSCGYIQYWIYGELQ
jgi:hypothetical protein